MNIENFIKEPQRDKLDLEGIVTSSNGKFADFNKLDRELRRKHGLPAHRRKRQNHSHMENRHAR